MTFEELNLIPPLQRAIREVGYTTPTPIQQKAIGPVLAGRDLIGCAQTGTGKTAAFALPILQRLSAAKPAGKRKIRALILTPTRELALQIGDCFTQYGKYLPLRHAVIFGGVGQKPQVDALQKGLDILVACPGRLNDLAGQGFIDLSALEIFVLDEADRMLDMGFIHDVKRVIKLLPDRKQSLLFSATMPAEIVEIANNLLTDPAFVKVDPVSSAVERIRQSIYFVSKNDKKDLLPWLLKGLSDPPVDNALVFSRTKHGADKIVRVLEKQGISAAAIHGNKSQNARVAALEGFKAGKTQVLVATDIAARGIDISELSYVFNYDLPEVPETYVHRIGRTARAGADGTAVAFCAPEELEYLRDIEKLIRRQIPRVTQHPWAEGGQLPPEPVQPQPKQKPEKKETPPRQNKAKKEEPKPAKPLRSAEKEEPTVEEMENSPQQESQGLSASAKRRRRRRRSHENAAAEAEGRSPETAKAPEKPAFDPRFLNGQKPAAPQTEQPRAKQPAQKTQDGGKKQPQQRPAEKPQQPKAKQGQPEQGKARQNQPEQARAKQNQPEQARAKQNQPEQGKAKQNQPRQQNPQKQPAEKPAEKPARPQRQAAPEKPQQPRAEKRPAPQEDPGLLLITRRPVTQKFASFEDYIAAHGGVTAPVEDYSEE